MSDPTSRYRALFQGWGGAILAVLAGIFSAFVVWAFHSGFPKNGFLFLYIPVIATVTYLGGRRAGALTALVSFMTGWYLIIPPAYSFSVRADTLPILLAFAAAGALAVEGVMRLQEMEVIAYRLALIVESSDDAIFSKSLDGTILTWNAGAERLYGYGAAEVVGRPVSLLAPPDRADEIPDIMRRLRRGERVDHYESVRVTKDGRRVDVSLSISPVRNRSGRIIGAATIARDITARKRAEQRAGILRSLTTALSGALTVTDVARICAESGAAAVQARASIVSLPDAGGEWLGIAAHTGCRPEDISLWLRVRADAHLPFADCLRSGQPIFLETQEAIIAAYPDCPREDLRRLGDGAWMSLPLLVSDRPAGVLFLAFGRERPLSDDDRNLLLTIVQQCAQALERARLYEAERSAREEAERAVERILRLQEISAALSGAVTPAAVAEVIVDRGVVALRARAGSLALLTGDGARLELVRAVGYPQEFIERWRQTPATQSAAAAAMRTREAIFLESRDALLAYYETSGEPVPVLPDPGARAVIPLTKGRDVIGVLSFLFAAPRPFAGDERAFIQTIARQCAQALERARLYEREHRVAATLQRALLPTDLPQPPGVAIHAAYLPGTSESEVGGDWYDAFWLPNGHIAVSVGDVMGRGLNAAVVMGQLRQTIRAPALEGQRPSTVLEHANKILHLTSGNGEMATALFGTLDPVSLTFTYAVAGHPVPVLATATGEARPVQGAGAVPLGVSEAGPPPLQTVSLAPGTLLVLYTDGLVELTRNPIEGESALLGAAAAERQEPSDNPAQGILTRMLRDRQPSDDIAVVTLSISGMPAKDLTLDLPAEPSTVRAARQAFNRLAVALEIDRAVAARFEVALGEAVNNVVEHAYGAGASGNVHLRVWREGDTLVAEIRDHGRWREGPNEGRGYGLQIMRALLDSAEVTRTGAGTIVRLATALSERSQGRAFRDGGSSRDVIDNPVD